MAISKDRLDRFTSKGSDFEIIKPAPAKKPKAPAKPKTPTKGKK